MHLSHRESYFRTEDGFSNPEGNSSIVVLVLRFIFTLTSQVNGQDVSCCSHEEAVKVLSEASQPILVEVMTRETSGPSERDLAGPSKLSQQVQTEFCDNCCSEREGGYYNYQGDSGGLGADTEESLIYPELQYEVNTGYIQCKHNPTCLLCLNVIV